MTESDNAKMRRAITYPAWTPDDVRECVSFWSPRTRGWFVTITDDVLAPHWRAALADAGRYAFSPLAYVVHGSRFRMAGDGPAQWSLWIVVARPKREPYSKWGALPGAYVQPAGELSGHRAGDHKREIGGKDDWIMRRLVADYSRPDDVVCDPCAGWGTTGAAALREGRSFIGSESRESAFAVSCKRLSETSFQPSLFNPSKAKQAKITLDLP